MDQTLLFILQIAIILGATAVIISILPLLFKNKLNMRSHDKVQIIALLGLTGIAITAILVGLFYRNNSEGLVALASAAVGGIAGYISHKTPEKNTTVLSPIEDKTVIAGQKLEFTLVGFSSLGYNLNYMMTSTPSFPEGDEGPSLDQLSGLFSWTPKNGDNGNNGENNEKEYRVTFTVNDAMGGSDSRVMNIKIIKPVPQE